MIIVFDMDDTLYPEISYVESGFRAVAKMLENIENFQCENIAKDLMDILHTKGRGEVFDTYLKSFGKYNKILVKKCITAYRNHDPKIQLFSDAEEYILNNQGKNLYVVTDGNKVVQTKKVQALNLQQNFKKIYITHRYGLIHSKPSLYCFQKIKDNENCSWSNILYVGDNPNKDFINLNKMKANTVRIMRGCYENVSVKKDYDAQYRINTINELSEIVRIIEDV